MLCSNQFGAVTAAFSANDKQAFRDVGWEAFRLNPKGARLGAGVGA